MSAPTLQYFPFRGRGEPIILFLEDAGVTYERVPVPDGWESAKQNLDEFPFNQVPILKIDGLVIAQQDAILRYLARKNGYATGDTMKEVSVDMLACAIEDLNKSYVSALYTSDGLAALHKFVDTTIPKVFKQLEYLLGKNDNGRSYFVYDKPSFPEFTLFHLVNAFLVIAPSSLKGFTLLEAWLARMSDREGIKKYLCSGRQLERINGPLSGQAPLAGK